MAFFYTLEVCPILVTLLFQASIYFSQRMKAHSNGKGYISAFESDKTIYCLILLILTSKWINEFLEIFNHMLIKCLNTWL